jgi:large repetitive protein
LKNQLSLLLLIFAVAVLSAPAYAANPNCGDTITTSITLTDNMNCTSTALVVGASGVTIDLGGFTITCHMAGGFMGSCQNRVGQTPVHTNGIMSTGHNAVTVRGPGTIWGFEVGVRLVQGSSLNVIGTTITGPVPNSDFPPTARALTVGVVVGQTNCNIGILSLGPSALVELNDISQQTQGVQLSQANCVTVTANNIHDNRGGYGDDHGIDLISSSFNTISANLVTHTGLNFGTASGIQAFTAVNGPTSTGNQIQLNYVIQNCGDGITLGNGASLTTVAGNTSLNNGNSTQNNVCILPAVGTFFDLADRNEGPGDTWNANNTCQTSNPGVPAGVCP